MRRALTGLALLLCVAASCRRNAPQPIAPAQLFPDASGAGGAATPGPQVAPLARAEMVVEQEPNNAASEAMAVGGNAVVNGKIGRAHV